ncbi:uncharacterized protein LOC131938288 [Physella acuta]|uniref:uncharacterized protein LOC131938288 n=1 Tax=Physella acuta TaxID=109671 RepID=UPI0027DBB715|nr:uncharacterized protein LOC131938288 [Physella acuta]
MASTNNKDEKPAALEDEEWCTIEASVVTGFEESARGEAKEKFGADVRASRGSITWKIPLDKVKDVFKMGSIDNFKVVMHSISHFRFTDQHDSLSRLQQMVADVDWESGLKVWRKFNDFPHPIPSKPEVIPSPEELVDVVVINKEKLPKAQSKEEKKKKKWGKGKKKDKRRSEGKGGGKGDVSKLEHGDCVDPSCVAETEQIINELTDSQDLIDAHRNEDDKVTEYSLAEADIVEKLDSVDTEDTSNEVVAGENKKISPYKLPPKTVIIKRREDSENIKIDIKVLLPNPEEDAFPKKLEEGDQRDVEPMEVDMSLLNASVTSTLQTNEDLSNKESDLVKVDNKKDEIETLDLTPTLQISEDLSNRESDLVKVDNKKDEIETIDLTSSLQISEDLSNRESDLVKVDNEKDEIEIKDLSDEIEKTTKGSCSSLKENEFASSVIEKLKSPPSSPARDFNAVHNMSPKNTSTPPPTPIRNFVSPFSDTPPAEDEGGDFNFENLVQNEGSSVDPVSFSDISTKKLSDDALTETTMTHQEPVESTVSPSQGLVESMEQNLISAVSPSQGLGVAVNEATTLVEAKKERDPTKPTFRVTCNRVGDYHPFDSPSAAASFGSAIITYHKWAVDLKNFDIEVILNIDNEQVTVSLALTKNSLHMRNLVAFGPTTLRATICYNMLRLCHIKNGDFICDPMCGTGAIPIEGAVNWQNCFHIGGDCHDKAIARTVENIAAIQEKTMIDKKSTLKLDAVQWNIEHFPLRDRCVDVFISDLPFGHRLGSRSINRSLYPCLLNEMARTANNGARACLLTEDKANLIRAIQLVGKYWQRRLVLSINIGGLSGFVFLLTRTTAAMAPLWGRWNEDSNSSTTVEDQVEPTLIPSPNKNESHGDHVTTPDVNCCSGVEVPVSFLPEAEGKDTENLVP